ncbi:hypothetical protein LCGC14_2952520 [marine sediment metagenome]|uniref:Uncharacterized protein n=1 Tax=marine sediment metagenome TaxID=412755 RepID=A0A0F8XFD4_9ZZZZ
MRDDAVDSGNCTLVGTLARHTRPFHPVWQRMVGHSNSGISGAPASLRAAAFGLILSWALIGGLHGEYDFGNENDLAIGLELHEYQLASDGELDAAAMWTAVTARPSRVEEVAVQVPLSAHGRLAFRHEAMSGGDDGERDDMKPYLCPVCHGAGTVSRPPGIAGDQETWNDSGTPLYDCLACDGTGVIWKQGEPAS